MQATCTRGLRLAAGLGLLAATAFGQAGDRAGEEQPDLPAGLAIPPAPALDPEEELATFDVAEGFRVELVAAEPLVVDPVVATFDAYGRLWVCEMRGYMPDVDGTNEDAPVGEIAILTDTDGDGRMDERTVFLDGLVLPRAVLPIEDGALVIAPPELFFARDTDGDGRADEREVIESGLAGIHSPEHAINGPIYTLDNWYRFANWPLRYRRDVRDPNGTWIGGATAGGGQWGITRDDVGRVFYNTNSDPLRGDLYPSRYSIRNPTYGRASGVNARIAQDFTVHPSRINPGVNRGYQPATLRDDFTLARFTGACAPLVQRGGLFPDAYANSVYVAEPCGNLIKRYVLSEGDGIALVADPAPPTARASEFVTSTDERFRPVNLTEGPDGALYVVDLYRGVIQHRVFVTSFLRKQILARGLEEPVGLGRIWRVVPEEPRALPEVPDFASASWTELAGALFHPNGWVRDTAQRLFVEEGRGDADAVDVLRSALDRDAPGDALGRIHALFALDGVGALRREHVLWALGDDDPRVRIAAMQLSEPWVATGERELADALHTLARRGSAREFHQALLTLGEANTRAADDALLALIEHDVSTNDLRSAVLSGIGGRELAFLEDVLGLVSWWADPDGGEGDAGRGVFLELLARGVVREGRADRIERMFDVMALCGVPWQQAALVRGVLAGRPKSPTGGESYIRLASEPAAFASFADVAWMRAATDWLAWPGRPGIPEEERIEPLTDEEAARFERGRELFADTCASCHQTSGRGDPGKAPALVQSKWVLGEPDRLVKILIAGLDGPLEIEGVVWDAEMPAFVASDDDIASVATYVRREWGHGAAPIDPAFVTRIREATAERKRPWTAAELER